MSNKNSGEWSLDTGLYQAGDIKTPDRRRGGVKRAALYCGAILGAAFALNVSAGVEVLSDISSEEVIQMTVQDDRAISLAGMSEPVEQQAMLKVSGLHEDFANQPAAVQKSDQGRDDTEEGKTGVPYAILLAIVALIGLVPVARRSGGV